jgi:hypothetical protein
MKKSLFAGSKPIQQMSELRQNLAEIESVQLATLTKRVLSHYLRQQMLPLQLPSKSCQENFPFECYLLAKW